MPGLLVEALRNVPVPTTSYQTPAEGSETVLQPIRCLLDRFLCFRPERELAESDFHRRINHALQGTHNNAAERALRAVAL